MSSYTRGKKRPNTVFVYLNNSIYFGFKPKDIASITGVTASDITALGHIPPSGVPSGRIKVVGAKAPQPPRVMKKLGNPVGQQQSASTFCAYNSLAAAQTSGWSLIKSRRGVTLRSAAAPRQSLTAIATLGDGSLYCFPMNKTDFESYGAELGLQSSTLITSDTEREKLVSGASLPYPGRASKLLSNGSTFSSFFSTASQGDVLDAGYDIISEEKILAGNPPDEP